MTKSQHIRVRVSDQLRQAIEAAALAERRSLSNWIINVIEDRLAGESADRRAHSSHARKSTAPRPGAAQRAS